MRRPWAPGLQQSEQAAAGRCVGTWGLRDRCAGRSNCTSQSTAHAPPDLRLAGPPAPAGAPPRPPPRARGARGAAAPPGGSAGRPRRVRGSTAGRWCSWVRAGRCVLKGARDARAPAPNRGSGCVGCGRAGYTSKLARLRGRDVVHLLAAAPRALHHRRRSRRCPALGRRRCGRCPRCRPSAWLASLLLHVGAAAVCTCNAGAPSIDTLQRIRRPQRARLITACRRRCGLFRLQEDPVQASWSPPRPSARTVAPRQGSAWLEVLLQLPPLIADPDALAAALASTLQVACCPASEAAACRPAGCAAATAGAPRRPVTTCAGRRGRGCRPAAVAAAHVWRRLCGAAPLHPQGRRGCGRIPAGARGGARKMGCCGERWRRRRRQRAAGRGAQPKVVPSSPRHPCLLPA